MVVSKDIHINYPGTTVPSHSQLIIRTGTIRAEGSGGSEEDMVRSSKEGSASQKGDYVSKADSTDNLFIEDVSLDRHFYCDISHNMFSNLIGI